MKNILLAVTGLSPQVITETLYAIHASGRTVHEIHVITTREGKDRIHADLLSGESGHYFKYLNDYGHDPRSIRFNANHIHTLLNDNKSEIHDILSESDNERLLETCLDLTFELTRDPETAVFFSVAGGRKTMSACLTLAAQLYGRPQDRLYHVLVSQGFENNRDFYYPPRENRTIGYTDAQGEPVFKNSRYAKVTLVNIPFVSVRSLISPEQLDSPKDPGTLMMSLIRDPSPQLTLDLQERKIHYRTVECDMPPVHLALYAFFAQLKKACDKDTPHCGTCTDCFLDYNGVSERNGDILTIYNTVTLGLPQQILTEDGILNLDADNFRSIKSKIKTALSRSFGIAALFDLEIASIGKIRNVRYGIPMDKTRITILWPGQSP